MFHENKLGHTLIIRPGALGDAVLTLPALHALRLAGAASLTVLGTPSSWGFIRSAHESLRVRDFTSSDWLGLFADGASMGPSAKAALARTQSAVIYLPDSAPMERSLKEAGVAQVLFALPPRIGDAHPAQHAAWRLLHALPLSAQHLNAAQNILGLDHDLFLTLDQHEHSRALERAGFESIPPEGFFAVHIGSGGRKKCWPADSFARLVTQMKHTTGATPLVFFGPADDDVRAEFEHSVPPGVSWENASNLPQRDVLALLHFCKGYVGNDSGMTHLAARACPTLALFGPTDPRIWSPLGRNVRVLQAPGGAMEQLAVDEVLDAIHDLINDNETST